MNNNAMMIKTKAIFGERLKASNYQSLLQKKDISEIAGYLKNETYYSETLEGINEKSIHRGQLENLIRMDVFTRYPKILKYATKRDGDFYEFIIIDSEITLILNAVRSFMSEDKTELIANIPMFLSGHTKFHFENLAEVNNIYDLLELLQDTPYYPILEKYKENKIEEFDFAGLEHSLMELYYYEVLRLARKNYKGAELKAIEDILVTKVELENLAKIYRLKKYFNASPNIIKTFITPIYRYFSKQALNDIIENANADEVLSKLKKSKYGNYMGEIKSDRFEYYVKRINYEISKHYIYFSSNAEVVLLAYFVLVETEIQNIIDIIEGARYRIPAETINRILIY